MALIKCTGCGHDVSDKASACPHCGCPISQDNRNLCKECRTEIPNDAIVCPNCGCPTDNTKAFQKKVYYDEEPEKKRWWIWALGALLLCLIGGGYYAYTKDVIEATIEEKKDSVELDVKEDIVELTPEFIQTVKKYDIVGEFSGGYAAVHKGEKWGYINTKDEEIITNINADTVGKFSEGLAVVVPKSDVAFYVIDTKGNTVFKGESIHELWDIYEIPYFNDGLLYVHTGNDYTIYDKQGNITGTVDIEVGRNFYKNHEIGDYTIFSKTHEDWFDEFDDYNRDITYGLKDSSGKVVLAADYDNINGKYEGTTNFSNGVVLVIMREYDEEFEGAEDTHTIEHVGYADLKGNDTFSAELKNRCKRSKITAMQNKSNDNSDNNDYKSDNGNYSANETNEDLSWIQGNWRCSVDVFGDMQDYRVGIADKYITVFMNGEHFYTGPYEIRGNKIMYKDNIYLLIDRDRQVIMADKSTTMYRF